LLKSSKFRLIVYLSLVLVTIAYSQMAWADGLFIDLSLAPPVINADGGSHEVVVVQLRHGNGQPYIAPENVTVYLTSSNLDVGSVSESVVIPAGRSYARGVFDASYNAGVSLITASAEEFMTDDVVLQVIKSDFDARLTVTAAPPIMPAVKNVEGRAIIQIMDYDGNPYNALMDVDLTLSSSNHSVLTLPAKAVIGKGTNYVEVTYIIQGELPGGAIIYAHAQNFDPGHATVTITNETRKPYSLALYFAPNVLLPDQATHEAVTVQLLDVDGHPVKATKNTVVTLTSSNLNIATVTDTLTIPKDQYHASTTVNTRYLVGDTIVAASSPSLNPVDGTLVVKGNLPRTLEVYMAPSTIIADGEDNEIITIQVLDEEGNPILADHDITVYLSSSSPRVGTVPVSGTIDRGSSYITVPFKATIRPGTASIIVATQGLEPSEAKIVTVALKMNVTLTTPKSIVLNQTFTVQVNVTSFGQPVSGADVKWTALGGVLIQEDGSTDGGGVAEARIVQKYEQLNLKAEVAKAGYLKETAQKSIKITQTSKPELVIDVFGYEVSLFVVLIVVAMIIAVSVGGYVYLKYRKKKEGEQQDLELFP
jgi:hypothetical protein